MPVIEIDGRRIRIDEDGKRPSKNPVINLARRITEPSRRVQKAVSSEARKGGFASPLLDVLPLGRQAQELEKLTRLMGLPIAGKPVREAQAAIAGEAARTATNPIDVATIGLTPARVASRLGRLVIGGGLGALSAASEEGVTPKSLATRAGIVGLVSAIPGGRKLKNVAKVNAPSPTDLTPGPSSISPMQQRVNNMIDALEKASPIRGEQEAIFTQERGKRLARVLEVRARKGGEAGFRAELAQLKGEFPKIDFESIRRNFNQSNINALFDDINNSNISDWNKVPAKHGLAKLISPEGGQVPTENEIALLGEVFGPKFVKALRGKQPLFSRLAREGIEVANVPRAVMASYDLSAPLRQGLFFISHPRRFGPAFADMFKQFASPKYFEASQNSIKARPTHQLMQKSKLSLTEVGGALRAREEAFMSRLAGNIPGVGASNRGFVGFLNKLRADVFDDFVKKGQQLGIAEDPGYLRSVARYINAATGRGELGRMEPSAIALNTVFFSPRLLASRINLLNPLFYASLHPTVRKRAIADLLTMTSAGLSVLGLAKMAGADVESDPTSSDFGKIKIGNTRYDTWGGFQQYVVALARILSGEYKSSITGRKSELTGEFGKSSRADIIFRFLQSKQAPVLSFITTMLRGQTIGRGEAKLAPEIVDRFIPFFLQDLSDIIQEHGVDRGWMAVPGAFGVGIQTYGNLIPFLDKTPSGRTKVKFRDRETIGEEIVNRITGQSITNLPERFHAPLAATKKIQTQRKIDLEEAKEIVKATGHPVRVGTSIVSIDDRGIIRTRTERGTVQTPEKTLEALLNP